LHFLSLLAGYTEIVLRRLIYIAPFFFVIMLFAQQADAQYKIMGTVYDSSRNYPLEAVSVMSTSGRGTITNADGMYQIEVSEKDSIWFSYLGKPTMKFPVLKIGNPTGFDISLQVSVTTLKEVKIRQRNYKQDSIQNRNDYAKIFNYRKPGLKAVTPQYGAAAGFDLEQIISIFQFRKNRSMLSFQKRLLLEEREKFITHRFSKALVRRLTSLDGQPLDSFMLLFRPSYHFTQTSGDYDFQQYIKIAYNRFQRGLLPEAWMRIEDDDE
jgi:hypothetical protein